MHLPCEPIPLARKAGFSVQLWMTLFLACIVIPFQMSQPLTGTAHAQSVDRSTSSYSCIHNPNTGSGHCYGIMRWPGSVQGEKTDIEAEPITCGCNGFLTAELWVMDTSTSGCNPFSACWVEAGIINPGHNQTISFWSDKRPGSVFYQHFENNITNGDFGHSITFWIYRIGSNEWQVSKTIAGVNGCTSGCSANWTYDSTNNSMAADEVHIGEELYGTSGASSPFINFTYNYYLVNGTWYPQGAGSLGANGVEQDLPPYAYWNGSVGGSTGGDFLTTCC